MNPPSTPRAARALCALGTIVLCALLTARSTAQTSPARTPATATSHAARGQSSETRTPITVYAASSTTDALEAIVADWHRAGGAPVRLRFGASSRLARQLAAGAEADIFVSAHPRWIDHLAERDVLDASTRTDLFHNRLVLVVPDSPAPGRDDAPPIESLASLRDPSLERIAVAGPHVPAGQYARQALRHAGVLDALEGRLVDAPHVRAALEWVARGSVTAGIVYRSDAHATERVRIAELVDRSAHDPIVYQGAILRGAPRPAAARDLLDSITGPVGARHIRALGFDVDARRASPTIASSGPEQTASEDPAGASGLDPWEPIGRSVLVGLLCALLGLVPATGIGYVLARRDFPGKTPVSALIFAPMVLPPVVTGYLLLSLLGPRSVFGAWLASLGIEIPFTLLGAILASLVVGFPLYVLSVRTAFAAVDRSLEELSWTLGAPPHDTFWRVSIPLALPGIGAGALLAFARALGEFGATAVLAGDIAGRTRTVAMAVYALLDSPGDADAIGPLLIASIALSLAALFGYERLMRWQHERLHD